METFPAECTEQGLSVGSVLGMSSKQVLEMSLERENDVLWGEVGSKVRYVYGMRISG